MVVTFEYESHDATGQWDRAYGDELWKFDDGGFMRAARPASTTRPSAPKNAASGNISIVYASHEEWQVRQPLSRTPGQNTMVRC